MIAKSYYVLAEEYCDCSLYQSQISYRDEFVFEEEYPSYPGHIAVQYDIPNNPDHQLVPRKSKVYLKKKRKKDRLETNYLYRIYLTIYRVVVACAPNSVSASVVSLSGPRLKM